MKWSVRESCQNSSSLFVEMNIAICRICGGFLHVHWSVQYASLSWMLTIVCCCLQAIADENRLDYKVEFVTTGFTGPHEVTLWGKHPPATLGRGQKLNHLPLELRPIGVGLYVTQVCLRSVLDVRILDIEAKISSLGTRAELTLSIPARQQIVQEIPFINNSETEWKIVADLQVSENNESSRIRSYN